jgi:hypothetical protein
VVTDAARIDVDSDWKRFMRRHWRIVATFWVAGILAVAGAVDVFLWFVGNAQSSGLAPRTLGLSTMGNLVSFILNAIFWELLLVGVPVVVAVVGGWLLWKRLPREEMRGSPLSQALSYNKGWWRSIALLLHRILHQGLSRRKLESSHLSLDPGLSCRFYGPDFGVDSYHRRDSCCYSGDLVDALPNEEALACFV